jgi:hypothetical protein
MIFLYLLCHQSSRNAYGDCRNMSLTSIFEHFDAENYRFDVACIDLSYPFALFLACNWLLSVTDVKWIVSDAYSNGLIAWCGHQFRGSDTQVTMGDQTKIHEISSLVHFCDCGDVSAMKYECYALHCSCLTKERCKNGIVRASSLWKQCHWSCTMCKISLHNAYFLAWFIRIMLWYVHRVYLIAFECFYTYIGYINSQFDQFTYRKM